MLTVGFDLDMTLVDSRPGIRASMAALTQETGVPVDVDIVIDRLGPKLEWELAQWFPAEQVAHACKRYRAHYWEHCVGGGTILLPGARAAVEAVRTRDGRVLVVTA
jgi:phosphoglycolate phosphatase